METFIENALKIYPNIDWNAIIHNIGKYAIIRFNDTFIRTYVNEYAFTNEKELNPLRKMPHPELSKTPDFYSLHISTFPKLIDPDMDFNDFFARVIVFGNYDYSNEYLTYGLNNWLLEGHFELIDPVTTNSWKDIMTELGIDKMRAKCFEARGPITNAIYLNWDANDKKIIIEDQRKYYILTHSQ